MRTFVHALFCLLLAFAFGGEASAAPKPKPRTILPASIVITDNDGVAVPDKLWLERGVVMSLQAKALDKSGKPMALPITWIVDPAPVARISVNSDGSRANLVTAMDLFDTPNKLEPWTNVRACVQYVCKWVFVTSIVSLSGKWLVEIDVFGLPFGIGDQTREMKFVQNGRRLEAFSVGKDAGNKPMVATIRGAVIDFEDPNRQLTSFSGSAVARERAVGTWRSRKKHEGEWQAFRLAE